MTIDYLKILYIVVYNIKALVIKIQKKKNEITEY